MTYPIPIGDHSLQELHDFLSKRKYAQVLVLVDENTREYCYPELKKILPDHKVMVISPGENHKTLETCTKVWDTLTRYRFDRNGLIINLGGGVIGDMGGFIAGTYKRGIDFVQVPTTLLSMVDASVGGKVGIDYEGYKNHLGLFVNPQAVFIYPQFLTTLPILEIRSGFAEVIKHHLIADQEEWASLIQIDTLLAQDYEVLIRHSVAIKSRIVELDPDEQNDRKALNFGHTIGHAIERYFLATKHPMKHGDAVALGMVCESFLSYTKGWIPETALHEINQYILTIFGKEPIPAEIRDRIWQNMLQDKKNLAGTVRASLVKGPGGYEVDVPIERKEVETALDYYSGLSMTV